MTQKVALITGITGQDGSYLAEFLLGKGLYRARHQAAVSSLSIQTVLTTCTRTRT
jgi:GDPmannose 4,6-dehydratase